MPNPHGRGTRIAIAVAILAGVWLTPLLAATASAAEPGNQQTTGNTVNALTTQGPGDRIAATALKYYGYAYVWYGDSPDPGFDCSGYTQWVVNEAIGLDIGRSPWMQAQVGTPVEWDTWKPGDLIVFANTWDAGISHVGIYLGAGNFIHAEMEETGVTIDNLYTNDFYRWHYYEAYRLVG